MKLLHKKSTCCAVRIIHFGGKRRQCTACKKTWRVHPAKQGRKSSRKQCHYLKKILNHGLAVKQLALHSCLSPDAIYKRFVRNLDNLIGQKRIVRIRGSRLILLIDAQWQYFKGKLWTQYLLAAKSTGSVSVTVFDPVLKRGKESSAAWGQIVSQLPPGIKKRVIALVSDGIRGIETISSNNGWIIQRCHFHLLSQLQKMRGKRASTPGRLIREEIYSLVKSALSETSTRKLNILCKRLAWLVKDDHCPTRMRMVARDFLRRLPEFRSYLKYPDLCLPVTVNVMESINSFIRRKTRTINSPKAWHKWTIACVRFKSKFICK